MKIAILSHLKYPIAQPFAGGLEMHTHLLADTLLARGHDVTLFAAHGSDAALALDPICPPTGEQQGHGEGNGRVEALEVMAYRDMMDRVLRGNFDVVHNNSLHFIPLATARAHGLPMLTALHTPPFAPLTDGLPCPASTFVAVSDHLATQWGSLIADIAVIPNGIDLTVFHPRLEPSVTPSAIWSGRIVPEKGLHLAIDAARSAKLPLRFAGPPLDAAYWADEIAPRLGDDVTNLGHLAHDALARELAAAGVAIVSPRWDEPFGLVVAEALACGTPVAAFARGAIPSLIDDRHGALARPDDSRDLGRAILRALACRRLDCRAQAERRFDAEQMVDRYERRYETIVASARPAESRMPRLLETVGGAKGDDRA